MARAADWSFESEPGPHRRREDHAHHVSAGLFVPSGKASYPSVAYQLGGAGHGRRRADSSRWWCRRCPTAAAASTRRCWWCAASWASPRCSASTARRAWPRSGFGTETIPQVRKIVGPGSPPVACAQVEMQRYGVATMMILGPTESVVIADDTRRPAPGRGRPVERGRARHRLAVLLITTSVALADAVDERARTRNWPTLPPARAEAARAALGANGGCVFVGDLGEAAEVANRWAPEHLQVAVGRRGGGRAARPAGQRRRDPHRPAHAVQRRQLRHRLPGQPAHRRLRARQQWHHRRHVPEAHRGRPRRCRGAARG